MRAILLVGLLLISPAGVYAQTAEQTVLQLLIGTKKYESMKVTRLDECRFKMESVLSVPTGEFAIVDFSKMTNYAPRRLPNGDMLIRMSGSRDFVFWRLRERRLVDGQFRESYSDDYEYELKATDAAALSIAELKTAEMHFRQQYCKRP